jgi:four helix bundle protein
MENAMPRGDDIQKRLIKFAARVVKLSDKLPNSKAGRHIAGQILRSGTSPAPNYAEARGTESN